MLAKNLLYYGRETPLPQSTQLRAGPLTMLYEEGDLRYIQFGDREVLRRIYVAIRDRNWGTVPNALSNVQMDVKADSFRVTYEVVNRQNEIDFAWKGAITGDADGTLRCTMEGEARATFLRARIGFCVLHPLRECIGQPCAVEHVDGTVEEGMFPVLISPHQPFLEIRALRHEVAPGLHAEVRFDGEVFEMEDHRNWSDASFKTYGTPLRLPYPVEVPKGTRITQSVTLKLLGEGAGVLEAARPGEEGMRRRVTFEFAPSATRPGAVPLPAIGLGTASHGQLLSATEIARLKALSPAHLRVDLRPAAPGWEEGLRRAAAEASALGVPLEAALHLSDEAEAELKAIAARMEETRAKLCRWLVFHVGETSTDARWVQLARERLSSCSPGAAFLGGTDAYFAELNRGRPEMGALDGVTYSINPQVHAFDNASLVENLEAQAHTVESARAFAAGRPISVSPVTLRPRFNPNATGPEPEPSPDEGIPLALPFEVDERQVSLFGAGWTLGSVKYLAESGAASVTYYETSGWRGVMGLDPGVAAGLAEETAEPFAALRGAVYPVYHVLADIGEFAGGELLPTTSGDPLALDGLALVKEGRTRLLLANLSPMAQAVAVQVTDAAGRTPTSWSGEHARVRVLDERNAEEAMRSPEAFRAREGEPMPVSGGWLELELLPYAVARIDVS